MNPLGFLNDALFNLIKGWCISIATFCCDGINEFIGTISSFRIFTLDFASPELVGVWSVASSVALHVSMVLAYALLGFFVALEFYTATQHIEKSKFGGIEMIMRCLIKILIVKLVVDNTPAIMRGLYDLSVNITHGVEKYALSSGAAGQVMPKDAILNVINSATGDQIGLLFIIMLVMLVALGVTFATCIFIQVYALGRFIEIFVCVAFGALPIVCLLGQDTKQIGINFIKNYASVCLQGAVIVLLLKFVAPLFAGVAVLLSNMVSTTGASGIQIILTCVPPLALSFSIFGAVKGSRGLANKLVGA